MSNCSNCRKPSKQNCCDCQPNGSKRRRRRGPPVPPRGNCCGFESGDLFLAAELQHVADGDLLFVQGPYNITSFRIGNPAPGVRSFIVVSGPVPSPGPNFCSGAIVDVSIPRFGPPFQSAGTRYEAQLNLLSAEPVPGRPDCVIATTEIVYVNAATGALVDPAVVTAESGVPFSAIHFSGFMGGTAPPLFAT